MSALLHLSFVRLGCTGKPPPTPTNEERVRAFRAAYVPQLANGHPWPWIKRQDAKQERRA